MIFKNFPKKKNTNIFFGKKKGYENEVYEESFFDKPFDGIFSNLNILECPYNQHQIQLIAGLVIPTPIFFFRKKSNPKKKRNTTPRAVL